MGGVCCCTLKKRQQQDERQNQDANRGSVPATVPNHSLNGSQNASLVAHNQSMSSIANNSANHLAHNTSLNQSDYRASSASPQSDRQGSGRFAGVLNRRSSIGGSWLYSRQSSSQAASGLADGSSDSKPLDGILKKEDAKRADVLLQTPDVLQTPAVPTPMPRYMKNRKLASRKAWTQAKNHVVCSACGTPLCSAKDITSNEVAKVMTDDSRQSLCIDGDINASYRESLIRSDHPLKDTLDKASPQPHSYTSHHGDLRSIITAPPAARVWVVTSGVSLAECHNTVCRHCYCFVGVTVTCKGPKSLLAPPKDMMIRPESPMKTLNDEVTATYTFLGFRYIRMLNPWSLQPVQPRIPLLCVHCKRTLSYTDQILCTKRRWSFGTASAQNACYMNTVRLENINVGSFREERLAQGRFIMGDMNCVCGAIVGYKFCKDLTRDSRNIYQVGRFGLVSSCFVVSQQTCLDCD